MILLNGIVLMVILTLGVVDYLINGLEDVNSLWIEFELGLFVGSDRN